MLDCKCGYTIDKNNQCNGTHKVVKQVKQDLIKKIDEIGLGEENDQLNGLGMKMLIKDLLK